MELTAPRFSFDGSHRQGSGVAQLFLGASALLTDASGGSSHRLTSDGTGGKAELFALPTILREDRRAVATAAGGVVRALDDIQNAFGLNTSQMGDVLGVTRKTVYDWQAGAAPRRDKLDRLFRLRRAALDWQRSGFHAPGSSLHEALVGGQSLWHLLCTEPLDLDAIHFAGGRLQLRDQVTRGGTLLDPFG
jgi:hypothetical protein